MRINKSSSFFAIKLGEGEQVPNKVQVLRVGKFKHPQYGNFEITTQTLAEMKANFDARIRGIDVSFDYYHESNEDASAWVNELILEESGTELWAIVDWTPKAQQKLAERELRYFSPDFAFQWEDPETGSSFNNVLFGGGLTNRPFVKEMQAIVADETKTQGDKMTELEKAQAALKLAESKAVKLSEDLDAANKKMEEMVPKAEGGGKVAELEAKIAALQAELAKEKESAGKMLEEKKKLEEDKMLAEKKAAFNVLLTEGKACAAQEAAYIKGDMVEFIKLAQPLNLKPAGTSNSGSGDADADAIIKLAEEKQKANPKLSRGDAISIAKKELKK